MRNRTEFPVTVSQVRGRIERLEPLANARDRDLSKGMAEYGGILPRQHELSAPCRR